jgi:hypothetical protein
LEHVPLKNIALAVLGGSAAGVGILLIFMGLFAPEAFSLHLRNLKMFFRSEPARLDLIEGALAIVLMGLAILLAALWQGFRAH